MVFARCVLRVAFLDSFNLSRDKILLFQLSALWFFAVTD